MDFMKIINLLIVQLIYRTMTYTNLCIFIILLCFSIWKWKDYKLMYDFFILIDELTNVCMLHEWNQITFLADSSPRRNQGMWDRESVVS